MFYSLIAFQIRNNYFELKNLKGDDRHELMYCLFYYVKYLHAWLLNKININQLKK